MVRTALVEYFTTRSKTFIFGVVAGREAPLVLEADLGERDLLLRAERLIVDFHGLPPDWETGPSADTLRAALALEPRVHPAKRAQPVLQRNLAKPAFGYGLDYWEDLSETLLPAALQDELEACDLVCVVPHGSLHGLPFAALRMRDGGRLIERLGLCSAPSASVLRWCRAKNRAREESARRPPRCLIAAVAAADDEDPADFEADGDALAGIAATRPGARVTRLVGAAGDGDRPGASKRRISAELPGHDVVHFACHGLFESGGAASAPLDNSGLLVSDGARALALAEFPALSPAERAPWFLTAREILGARLDAELVTLRACSSGRSELTSGDELLGLLRAFLHAGTPSVVATLWNVHKRSSQRLLEDFYGRWLGDGVPKWRALQLAQQSLLRDGEYDHPYHWAPFALVGDWL